MTTTQLRRAALALDGGIVPLAERRELSRALSAYADRIEVEVEVALNPLPRYVALPERPWYSD